MSRATCPKGGSALILAGGASRRMGFDKQLLQTGSAKMMDRMVGQLSPLFEEILISTNKPEYYRDSSYVLVRDELGVGPMAGIYSGLKACADSSLYVIACDMPFLSLAYIRYMKALTEKEQFDACVARRPDGYYEPFNAMYTKGALPWIEDALVNNRYGINRLLDRMDLHVVSTGKVAEFDCPNMFFNANYKEDLEMIETLL